MTTPLTIDIISDVICPWCYVGKRNFDRALAARPDIDATLHWRPFQLDPSVPPEGVDRKSYLRAKFGDDERLAAISRSLRETAVEAGLSLHLDAIAVTPNTLDAHRVLHWAGGQGHAHAMAERLFAAYFTEGQDVGNVATLAALAGEAGLDPTLVASLLASEADRAAIRAEVEEAHRLGVNGVPTFIIDGKWSVTGAQPPEIWLRVFDKLVDAKSGGASAA